MAPEPSEDPPGRGPKTEDETSWPAGSENGRSAWPGRPSSIFTAWRAHMSASCFSQKTEGLSGRGHLAPEASSLEVRGRRRADHGSCVFGAIAGTCGRGAVSGDLRGAWDFGDIRGTFGWGVFGVGFPAAKRRISIRQQKKNVWKFQKTMSGPRVP